MEGNEPKSKSKLIIIIIVGILLICILGGGLWYFMLGGNKIVERLIHKTPVSNQTHESVKKIVIPVDNFIIDLISTGRKNNFLKLKILLELNSERDVAKINDSMVHIRDILQSYLRNLREDDLKGSAGSDKLREEILFRVNKIVYPAKVNNILFSEILVN